MVLCPICLKSATLPGVTGSLGGLISAAHVGYHLGPLAVWFGGGDTQRTFVPAPLDGYWLLLAPVSKGGNIPMPRRSSGVPAGFGEEEVLGDLGIFITGNFHNGNLHNGNFHNCWLSCAKNPQKTPNSASSWISRWERFSRRQEQASAQWRWG